MYLFFINLVKCLAVSNLLSIVMCLCAFNTIHIKQEFRMLFVGCRVAEPLEGAVLKLNT